MTPQKLFSDLSAGKFKPVYFFYGSETYRLVEAEKFIARQFLPDRQVAVNYRRIDGGRCSCVNLLAELSVYPMLGERQVISVSDFQRYKQSDVDRILKLLDPPDPNRVVVLSSPKSKIPKRNSAFLKKIAGVAETVEFKKLTKAETTAIVRHKLDKASLTVLPEALDLLVELIAGNRGALEAEVSKLVDYKMPGEAVSVEDIRKVAAGFQVYSIFELADEVTDGTKSGALRRIEHYLAEGISPTGILFFLGQHFISLYLVKIGKSLEPHRRFLTSKYIKQAAGFTLARMEEMICLISETDAAIRRAELPAGMQLEQLVLKMMSSRN